MPLWECGNWQAHACCALSYVPLPLPAEAALKGDEPPPLLMAQALPMLAAALLPASSSASTVHSAPGAAEALASTALLLLPHALQQPGASTLLRVVLLAAAQEHARSLTPQQRPAARQAFSSSTFGALGRAACAALPSLTGLSADMHGALLKAWAKLLRGLQQELEALPTGAGAGAAAGAAGNEDEDGGDGGSSSAKKKKKKKQRLSEQDDHAPMDVDADGLHAAHASSSGAAGLSGRATAAVDSMMGLLCVGGAFEPGSLMPADRKRLCKALLAACGGCTAALGQLSSGGRGSAALRGRLLHAATCALQQLLAHDADHGVIQKHAGEVSAAVGTIFSAALQVGAGRPGRAPSLLICACSAGPWCMAAVAAPSWHVCSSIHPHV